MDRWGDEVRGGMTRSTSVQVQVEPSHWTTEAAGVDVVVVGKGRRKAEGENEAH